MNEQQKQLVRDNPNLSSKAIAGLLGISNQAVSAYRSNNGMKPAWTHKGRGIPYMGFDSVNGTWTVASGKRATSTARFNHAIELVDTLIAMHEAEALRQSS